MNKSILMGRLVRDPEIRYSETKDGEFTVANFRLAVDRKFVRKDGVKSDFFSCSAFGRLAEFAEQYLKQGIKVIVTGRFENSNYQNNDGEKVYSVRLMAEDIEFAESKKASESYANGEEGSGSRSSNRNAGRKNSGNASRSSASSRRDENGGRRDGGSRRSMQEEDYQEDYPEDYEDDRREERSPGRRSSGGRSNGSRNPDDRSSGSRSTGSRASGNRSTGGRGSANSGSGRRNSVDDDYMSAPEEELDFD